MFYCAKWIFLLVIGTAVVNAADSKQIDARFAAHDVAPDANPNSSFWHGVESIYAANGKSGEPVPGHKTEIRARWTHDNLYILFVCPYTELHLKPDPQTGSQETNHLWKWDVAEMFIGSDFQNIRQYKEFEVSPQGEWVDLDIDLDHPHEGGGVGWNSGFQVAAHIDKESKIWYGCMRIPYSAIDSRPAQAGNKLRVNFFRSQGPPSDLKQIAWQPTYKTTFHEPSVFGTMLLVK